MIERSPATPAANDSVLKTKRHDGDAYDVAEPAKAHMVNRVAERRHVSVHVTPPQT
jgi:hypothetical protein